MSEATAAALTPTNGNPPAELPAKASSFFDKSSWELIQRVAQAFSQSTLVPAQYQKNIANCIIALDMAQRLGASALQVMQNLYLVHNQPSWAAKFLIATFNQCGRFSSIRYEWQGTEGKDDWGCRAWAVEKRNGEKIVGPLITIALAKKEGWESKQGSKWKTIPELMLMYRAAAWLVKTYAPEISMGLSTVEEMEDIELERDPGGGFSAKVADATADKQADLRERYGKTLRTEDVPDADDKGNNEGEGQGETEEAESLAITEAVDRVNTLIQTANADLYKGAGLDLLKKVNDGVDNLEGLGVEQLTAIEKRFEEALESALRAKAEKKPKPASGKKSQGDLAMD
jgi:hypothetical protein